MSDHRILKVTAKRGRMVFVDLDNNIVEPEVALSLVNEIMHGANRKSFVYLGTRASDGLCKIGLTDDLSRRVTELGITLIHTIVCDGYGAHDARAVEARLHKFFEVDRVEGEWFNLDRFDLNLIQRNCATGEASLSFLDAFDEAFHQVAERCKTDFISVIAAELINGTIHDTMTGKAIWYAIQKLPGWERERGKEEDALRSVGMYELMSDIFAGRAKRRASQTDRDNSTYQE